MKMTDRVLTMAAFIFLTSSSASAATFTVTNTLDDLNPGSLRWAITQVNSSPGIDTIDFDIPPGTPQTIHIIQPLPSILSTVLIDGWSQGNEQEAGEEVPRIEIRAGLNSGSFLLKLEGPGSVLRGLAINGAERCVVLRHQDHQIYGNFIGLGLDGETQFSCSDKGIDFDVNSYDTDNITIGGEGNKRNVIVGTTGILVRGDNVIVKNNIIGLTASGQFTDVRRYHEMGIIVYGTDVEVDSNFIGDNYLWNGTGAGNTCWEGGICVKRQSKDVKITNNFIGVGMDGASPRPNKHGITVFLEAQDVMIRNNVISGNQETGIILQPQNSTGGASNVQVKDNIIGLSSAGGWVIDNITDIEAIQPIGIRVKNSDGLTIGSGNVISGNVTGVLVGYSTGVKIKENTIGLGLDKTTPYPNKSYGVHFLESYSGKIEHNIIAHNGSSGVGIAGLSKDVAILNNSIFNNTSLGIDLIPNGGVTLNDEGDGDTGSNDLLNYPVLNEATYHSHTNTLVIEMFLDTPGSALVQVFANAVPDATGYGEGKTFLGQANVSPGSQTVTIQLPFSPAPGLMENLSATSTIGGTSEFGKVLKKVKVISRENSDGEAIKIEKWRF